MANIAISDLHPAGSDFFTDSESYIEDLDNVESNSLVGGFSPFIYAGVLALESSPACVQGAVAGVAAVSAYFAYGDD